MTAGRTNRVFHVTPNSEGAGWQVKVQNTNRILNRLPRKREAVKFARDTATSFVSGRGTRRSFVIVHDRFGRFARTFSFSA